MADHSNSNDIFSSNGRRKHIQKEKIWPRAGPSVCFTDASPQVGNLFLSTSLLTAPAGSLCHAQIRLRSQQTEALRYHIGGDTSGKKDWTDPSFNDSTWPTADKGRWPMPPFYSDGIVLVRVQVPVRADAANRLSLRLNPSSDGSVDEIYVNGQAVDIQKTHSDNTTGNDSVDHLPLGQAVPGSTVHDHISSVLSSGSSQGEQFRIREVVVDETSILHLEGRADDASAILAKVPNLVLNSLHRCIGCGIVRLLATGWWTRHPSM